MKLVYIKNTTRMCAECCENKEGNFIHYKCVCGCCDISICTACVGNEFPMILHNCVCEEKPEQTNLTGYLQEKEEEEEEEEDEKIE